MLSPTVGNDTILATLLNDPNAQNQRSSVLSLINARSLAGLYALVGQHVPLLLNSAGTYDLGVSAQGTTGVPAVNTEGTRFTYSSGFIGFTPVATPTDFAALVGSATKTVRLLRLVLGGIATAAISIDVQLLKRTTANSGSTPVDPSIPIMDSNDVTAATAVFRTYTTTNPTTGTSAGIVRAGKLNLGVTGAAGVLDWDFTKNNDKALVLRGIAQLACLNWNGAAVPAGTSLSCWCEWSEEAA